MKKKEQESKKPKKELGTRYLTKFEIKETDVELPIQGQVRDPLDLVDFMRDLQNDAVSKVICIYLDNDNFFLGHQVFLGMTPAIFDTQLLYHYYALFLAKKFMIIVNHPGAKDSTPKDEDSILIRKLQADSQVLSFKPFFADYIIVMNQGYFSMAMDDGTACHCGHHKYDSDMFA